jgi:hypothetical protein
MSPVLEIALGCVEGFALIAILMFAARGFADWLEDESSHRAALRAKRKRKRS